MKHLKVDGLLFAQMIREGAKNLTKHVKVVDSLNVFPVPDGDTGTNMNLSFTSGVNEMNKVTSADISAVTKALSRGLLMGARGNSGVILSQLFRGFSKNVETERELNAKQFAVALKKGVETAYKAVMKPVEGTILTVSKDAANAAEKIVKQTDDIMVVMETVLQEAKDSLKRTPDLLPILKQVGVVDSGGQGLVYVYEGFMAALKGETIDDESSVAPAQGYDVKENKEEHVRDEVAEMMAAGVLSVEDIEFGYCTEFMIKLDAKRKSYFNEAHFRGQMNQFGDSLLVISDDELVKVHIHAEELSKVMELAQSYGGLMNIKIENMREQFLSIAEAQDGQPAEQQSTASTAAAQEAKDYGLIAVAMGDGIGKMFKGLGVDVVIQGGQTMNPSTEDFVKAIEQLNAKEIIILPNNSNIILAAEQSADLVDASVTVIPTKNVPQAMTALLHFNPDVSIDVNQKRMLDAKNHIKSGQVTFAVRDTEIDGVQIRKDDFMGIFDGKIVTTAPDADTTVKQLLEKMIDDESEVVTVIIGDGVEEDQAETLVDELEGQFDHVEIEVHQGGQPLYAYIVSVE
ncbi:DAK2 domain fusion protein YloV [Bacillus horti]|uniref:DAK2 domain fusion protein YloV n=2 Tax=Caldalkalibacillus horti TaxID=77523 RepID=A0ABT9W279_9BACI|nr:DAK2 domain fusion protein YloV [Bacillus horti]